MLVNLLSFLKCLLTIGLGIVCIIGDALVKANQDKPLLKAVCDNMTHGIVGLLSYSLVVLSFKTRISTIEQLGLLAASFVFSCVIDIDHFIMAKSWRLQVFFSLQFEVF